MKLNPNSPALLLDFTKLKGSAREALSSTLQRFLVQKLHFHWESDKTGSKPLHLQADAIIINSGDGCPVSLTHIRNGMLQSRPQENTRYFDVTTEHDEFLDALQELISDALAEGPGLLFRALDELVKEARGAKADEQTSARV